MLLDIAKKWEKNIRAIICLLSKYIFVNYRGQLAYINHLQGKANVALTEYNKVLKNKPSDVALVAVLSNNIVALHKVIYNYILN